MTVLRPGTKGNLRPPFGVSRSQPGRSVNEYELVGVRPRNDQSGASTSPSNISERGTVHGMPLPGRSGASSIPRGYWAVGQPSDRKSTRLNSSHVAISYAV